MSLFEELIEDRQEDEKIVRSFKTKDSLSPDIFYRDGGSFLMRDDVRKKLLSVCNNFIDSLGIEFFIHDIILTGSLANYNWSEYSDVDLHIILDMNEFGEENKNEILLRKIFKEFFDTKKDYWNKKYNVKIRNFDVEIYVQDVEEKHVSSGVYSLVQNKWIIEPEKEHLKIDDEKIIEKGEHVQKKIDSLFKNVSDKDIIDQIDCLRERIKKFRQCGLSKGGEYSYENLVFKLLRRNGYIEKLLDLKRQIINNKLSIK
jgi:predicted nucleotidyltransferase